MRTTVTVVLAGLLLAAPAANADEPTKTPDGRAAFAESDTNHDGAVDQQEFHERVVEIFYQADVDKNGSLDRVELQRLTFPDDFKDGDEDERVSMREFLRVRFEDYDDADTNDDGVLSVEEVVVTYEAKARR